MLEIVLIEYDERIMYEDVIFKEDIVAIYVSTYMKK